MAPMERAGKEIATEENQHLLAWSLGLGAASSDVIDRQIREGFTIGAIERLRAMLELDVSDTARILGISERTLARRRDAGRLKPDESDRLYRIARLLERATDVLGSTGEARQWLKRSQWGLGDRVPLRYAETEAGAREVEDLLGRIDYGVLA